MLSHIVDGLVLVQNAVDDTRKNASMVITPSNNGDGTYVFENSTLPGVRLTTRCGGKNYEATVTNN